MAMGPLSLVGVCGGIIARSTRGSVVVGYESLVVGERMAVGLFYSTFWLFRLFFGDSVESVFGQKRA